MSVGVETRCIPLPNVPYLLHWREFSKITPGTMSMGGAGTWDGIVLSGLLAALMAG